MSYELAICGVPAVLVALAGNQANPCRGWQTLTGAPYLGTAAEVTPDTIAATLGQLAGDRSARARMAAAGRVAVDGQGTERLTAALLEREMA
jgi:UDP-2,4-diacetamido-2,4,6-trideoxy-beta-L-altropyranose hydrolase